MYPSKGAWMEPITQGFGQNIAAAGPEITALFILSAFVFLLLFKVILPLANRRQDMAEARQKAELELESKREERKAKESESRDKQADEQNRLTGQWLVAYERGTQVQEQTNVLLAGFDTRMQVMEAALEESKHGSRDMADEVHEIHSHLLGETAQSRASR